MYPVFEKAYPYIYEYVKKRYGFFKELDGEFVIRKVGRALRLHFAVDDFVDWWDSDRKVEEFLKKEIYTYAVFKYVPENSKFYEYLRTLDIRPSRVQESKVYYIPLEMVKNEEMLLKFLTRRRRRDLKNVFNRLNKAGKWEITLGEISGFGEMLEWIGRRFGGMFLDEGYRSLLNEIKDVLPMDFWSLKLNGKNIAHSSVIKHSGVVYWWLEGFDENYEYESPLKVLLYHKILHYAKSGFKEFNFMKGEGEYKRFWAKDYRLIYRFEYKNPSLLRRFKSVLVSLVDLGKG